MDAYLGYDGTKVDILLWEMVNVFMRNRNLLLASKMLMLGRNQKDLVRS